VSDDGKREKSPSKCEKEDQRRGIQRESGDLAHTTRLIHKKPNQNHVDLRHW